MPKHSSVLAFVATSGALLLAALFVTSPVHAHGRYYYERDRDLDGHYRGGLMLALDVDYASAFTPDLIEEGGGGALRIGHERDLYLVTLIPELTLDYH
ncbi:MAG: hypothetical protein RL701_40, partial [Pseudomonadota bacterium]